jgi:predicted Fe-Mo cluster-binding NifX family protein
MKIAVTSTEKSPDSLLDRRFGRCALFTIYDSETEVVSYIDNEQNLNAAQGAGIQAAQNVSNNGINAVITGHCGPKAFKLLNAAGIAVFPTDVKSVQEAINLYHNGGLVAAENADVEGHWV